MRIQCRTVQHFLENLQGQHVFQNTVHVDKGLISLTDDPVRDSTSVQVNIQLSAVIQHINGGEVDGDSLVDCGWHCGVDRKTADGGLDGTKEFEDLLGEVQVFCKANDLKVMPGILGM